MPAPKKISPIIQYTMALLRAYSGPTLDLKHIHIITFPFYLSRLMSWQNQQNGMCAQRNGMCAQRRLRSAWASAQSDQSLRCLPEESLGSWLPIKRTKKTLIRLAGWPGWLESSLGAQSFCWFDSFVTCLNALHLVGNCTQNCFWGGKLLILWSKISFCGASGAIWCKKTTTKVYISKWVAAWQNQQNDLCTQQRQISLGICPVLSEASLSAWRTIGPLTTH